MARVSEQLKEFYGPLQSISSATQAAYEAMIQQYFDTRPGQALPLQEKNMPTAEAPADSSEEPAKKHNKTVVGIASAIAPSAESGSSASSAKKVKEVATNAVRMRRDRQKKQWNAALAEGGNDGEQAAAKHYRLWATEVLQPLNEQAFEILVRRADLMDTTSVPAVFRQFQAHVLAFRTLLVQWHAKDFSQLHCSVTYPEAFSVYVGEEFRRLKLRQASQLNTLHLVRRGGLLTWAGLDSVEMKILTDHQNDIRSRL